jgi:hypothetical protein
LEIFAKNARVIAVADDLPGRASMLEVLLTALSNLRRISIGRQSAAKAVFNSGPTTQVCALSLPSSALNADTLQTRVSEVSDI